MRLRSLVPPLILLGVSVGLSLVVVEIALRIFDPSSREFYLWPPYTFETFEFDAGTVHGIEGPSEFRINSRGLRADELTSDRAIQVLALGGSTTECLTLDQTEAWPARLQNLLAERAGVPVWVGNAGKSGHTSREHVIQAPILMDAYPDVDLVTLLVGVNDLGLRINQGDRFDPTFMDQPDVADRLVPRAFSNYPLRYRSDLPFYKRLELYARARRAKDRILAMLSSMRLVAQDTGGENLRIWRENRANAVSLLDDLPDMAGALAEYRRNLERIADAADERGVALVLITQPTLWRPDLSDEEKALLWWGGVGDFQSRGARTSYYSVRALEQGMRLYNETLLGVCRDRGLACLDLAARMPKDTRYFYDDMHFTEAGARFVAGEVAAVATRRLALGGS